MAQLAGSSAGPPAAPAAPAGPSCGAPSASNCSPGASSSTISCGGCPHACICARRATKAFGRRPIRLRRSSLLISWRRRPCRAVPAPQLVRHHPAHAARSPSAAGPGPPLCDAQTLTHLVTEAAQNKFRISSECTSYQAQNDAGCCSAHLCPSHPSTQQSTPVQNRQTGITA